MKALTRRIGSLIAAQKEVRSTSTLEGMLAECMEFGRPNVFCHSDLTWSCSVQLNSTFGFLQGEVKSGFKHHSPAAAVHSVLTRLRQLQ